ncbi:MAG TPA: BamA/TamA family outer membrane protein, partial [Novosphingobium sp.]|nr:BamA/TamA family outer membrane protein [Novosphingobium sp.]
AHPESWAGAALAADKASPAPEAGAAPVQANPQTTAENAPAPATPEAPPALNPASPLAEPGGFTLPWPGTSVDMSALPPLEQDPALPKAMSEAVTELTAIPLDLPGATSQPAAKVHRAVREPRNPGEAKQAAAKAEKRLPGGRVVLAYPDALQAFPERAAFEARFRELSSVQTPIGKDQDAAAQTAVRAASDRQLLLKLLAYFGYYDGEVNQALATPAQGEGLPQAGGGAITVRFDIQPGAHYRLGSVDLGGLADTGQDYPALRKAFAVQAGDPVSTARILAEVDHLTAALGEAGYPFAKLGAPALSVDHAREQASLSLPVTPGGKYRFGAITSNLPRYLPGRHLVDLARFHAGDTFRRSQMEDLHKAILATGLVSSAGIAPRETSPPKGDAPGQLALDVTMAKAPQHTIAGAIGYDTGEGFRLETSWEKRNIFPPEGSLRLRGVAGTNEQLAGVTVSRANFHGRDRTLSLDLYADNATLTAYAARKVGTALTYQRQTTLLFQKPWSWSVGLEAEASDEREGVPSGVITGRHMYITTALPLRAAFDASDDLLDPTHGGRISLRASPERSWTQGQVSNYVKLQLDAAAFHPLVKGVVEALRVRIGSIIGTGIDQIAPSRRFYAGGGGSIRGFGYELVGPLNSLGEPKGGLSLYEVSAETRVDTGW